MIAKNKRFVRLTGTSLALMVALALGAGPVVAYDKKPFIGCLGDALESYGECEQEADGFLDRIGCTVMLILDAAGCVSDAIPTSF